MHPPMGPPPGAALDKLKEPRPEKIKDIPKYLKKLLSKFFSVCYIFSALYGKQSHGYYLL